jgi:hypothetical protein
LAGGRESSGQGEADHGCARGEYGGVRGRCGRVVEFSNSRIPRRTWLSAALLNWLMFYLAILHATRRETRCIMCGCERERVVQVVIERMERSHGSTYQFWASARRLLSARILVISTDLTPLMCTFDAFAVISRKSPLSWNQFTH